MKNATVDGRYRGCRFTTCRKFKGLEADAVILVDFTDRTVLSDRLLFYVGASRARIRLEVVTDMDNDSCRNLMEKIVGKRDFRRPTRDLAAILNCMAVRER